MNKRVESQKDQHGTHDATDDAALETIRQLLLSPQQQEMSRLREHIDEAKLSAADLSHMLPASIDMARDQGDGLATSLGPVINGAIKESVKRDPDMLADAIAPIMMPAIRRSISQIISGMLQTFNRTLEHSLSWQGFKWRWEAIRTGRSFSEVAMLHSFIYRIEQVFLIDRETGLMLAHVADTQVGVIDADMVSGMLTAIQDFVRDSFADGKRELLNTMDCETYDVLIEYGSHAILAAVVSGEAPPEVRTTIAATLERIHVDYAAELDAFNGDAQPFEPATDALRNCLLSQVVTAAENASPNRFWVRWAWVVPACLLLALLVWGGLHWRAHGRVSAFRNATRMPQSVSARYDAGSIILNGAARNDWIEQVPEYAEHFSWLDSINIDDLTNLDRDWLTFLSAIDAASGLVVTDAKRTGEGYRLQGLRDPLARDPKELLATAGLNPAAVEMHWSPYRSFDDPIAHARIRSILDPPDGVSLQWRGDTLVVAGSATQDWWRSAEQRTRGMDLERIDVSQLKISDVQFDAYIRRLNNEPGIVVSRAHWHDGRFRITGVWDPLARDPQSLLSEYELTSTDVDAEWSTSVSDHPEIVMRRIRQELELPDTIHLQWREDTLCLVGTAKDAWIAALRERIGKLTATPALDLSQLVSDGFERIAPLKKTIENTVVYFNADKADLAETEAHKVDGLAVGLRELLAIARSAKHTLRVDIIGHSVIKDATLGKSLSIVRAGQVLNELADRNLPREVFTTRWALNNDPLGTPLENTKRGRVTFRVRLNEPENVF